MSIDHWLSEDGKKAIETMGWPEWDSRNGARYRLSRNARPGHTGFFQVVHLRKREARAITMEEALALLRDHARVWLHSENAAVYISGTTDARITPWEIELAPDRHPRVTARYPADDYDAALIAAILAVDAA